MIPNIIPATGILFLKAIDDSLKKITNIALNTTHV